MLNQEGFDLWADGYDKSVKLSEEADSYPFAGYREVLNTIYRAVRKKPEGRVLDIGFGTGILSKRLYDGGYRICGVDFSARMLEIAREKMPNGEFYHWDFSEGLPKELEESRFDTILCTYAIHHLKEEQKEREIEGWLSHLLPGGQILIGDVAFSTEQELEACRRESGGDWDEDELYPVEETLRKRFPNLRFQKISFCAGVLSLFENDTN